MLLVPWSRSSRGNGQSQSSKEDPFDVLRKQDLIWKVEGFQTAQKQGQTWLLWQSNR